MNKWLRVEADLQKKAARAALCADNLARMGENGAAARFEHSAACHLMLAEKVRRHVVRMAGKHDVARRHAEAA